LVCVGLSHEDNVHKMQVLTFVQIAEGKSELSFETIEKELQLELDEVEPFIIDGEPLRPFVCSDGARCLKVWALHENRTFTGAVHANLEWSPGGPPFTQKN